jgi:hypothetical protein
VVIFEIEKEKKRKGNRNRNRKPNTEMTKWKSVLFGMFILAEILQFQEVTSFVKQIMRRQASYEEKELQRLA